MMAATLEHFPLTGNRLKQIHVLKRKPKL